MKHRVEMRRKRHRYPLPGGVGLVIILALALWMGHWALTCVGSTGELRFSERRNPIGVGFTWGHSSGLIWAKQGQVISASYRVQMLDKGRVAFQVAKWRFWDRYQLASLTNINVRSSGEGSFSYAVPETGLYRIRRSRTSDWKGEATLAWSLR